MPLAPGARLGPYEIIGTIGAGGMGEVYRARDRRLNRDVALKVLPEAFARDANRLARFEREAQVLASLNHPNIAAIYGLEEGALVMELVEGRTLAERLTSGPILADEAIPIAGQIAEGLESAHEKGIIHRDLKPANVKITPAGTVKLLDFGLAKAVQPDPSSTDTENSPTITVEASQAGVILGTAAYMSPEQARGLKVDRRTDIWAFGVVLFEMLTGKRAFAGPTTSDTLAAVLKSEPDFSLLPSDLPPKVDYLLRRCLRKNEQERLRDIGEARIWLREAREAPPAVVAPARRTWLWAAALVAIALRAGLLVGRMLVPRAAPSWSGTLLGGPKFALGPRISPDGRTLAFQTMVDGVTQVAVMKPETGNWTVLTREHKRGFVQEISWSGDGTKLYFSRVQGTPRGIFSVPVLGGEEHLVLEDACNPEVLADGSLLAVKINDHRKFQAQRFWPDTGRLQPLPAELNLSDISIPMRAFPGGKEAVFYGNPPEGTGSAPAAAALYALDLASGRVRRLAPRVTIPAPGEDSALPLAVTPDGHSVLIDLVAGDLHRIAALPRDGGNRIETWFTLTQRPWYMDAGPDNTVFIDQFYRQNEAVRFSLKGGAVEHLLRAPSVSVGPAVDLPDGELLLSALFAGHNNIAIVRPGADPMPVVESSEEAGASLTRLGEDLVAFPLGLPERQVIAVASFRDGRIVRRIPVGGAIDGLAASPDGKTLYYVTANAVWSVAAEGGKPSRVCDGDGVAVDAKAMELVVKLHEKDRFRLARVSLQGGSPRDIPLGEIALTDVALSPNAVGPDGRLLVQVSPPDTWFYRPAVIDPNGKIDRVAVDYGGDIWYPGWTKDGRVLATGIEYNFGLWRFHQAGEK